MKIKILLSWCVFLGEILIAVGNVFDPLVSAYDRHRERMKLIEAEIRKQEEEEEEEERRHEASDQEDAEEYMMDESGTFVRKPRNDRKPFTEAV